MAASSFREGSCTTARHHSAWIEIGPLDGPLMIFVHGWPELGVIWEHQLRYFAARGWRCVAPDMRGYGKSSVPTRIADYAVREVTADLVELHDALGGPPALWIAHDWGCAPAWSIAAGHPDRCRGIVAISVPYFARGNTLANLSATVNRDLYPVNRYPVGQWDYWLYHGEHAGAAAASLEADVRATIAALYRRATPDMVGKPSKYSDLRARGGFFGSELRAPSIPRDQTMLTEDMFEAFVSAFEQTGFRGANAWYLNDSDNGVFAAEAPSFGRIVVPALFIHGRWDTVCDSVHSALADPMREDCTALSEVIIDAGHMVMLEQPERVNETICRWLGRG